MTEPDQTQVWRQARWHGGHPLLALGDISAQPANVRFCG